MRWFCRGILATEKLELVKNKLCLFSLTNGEHIRTQESVQNWEWYAKSCEKVECLANTVLGQHYRKMLFNLAYEKVTTAGETSQPCKSFH